MSVRPETLENAERDLDLVNRESKAGKKPSAADELQALRQRIAVALTTPPTEAPIPECRDCYRRGWMAALKSLEE